MSVTHADKSDCHSLGSAHQACGGVKGRQLRAARANIKVDGRLLRLHVSLHMFTGAGQGDREARAVMPHVPGQPQCLDSLISLLVKRAGHRRARWLDSLQVRCFCVGHEQVACHVRVHSMHTGEVFGGSGER